MKRLFTATVLLISGITSGFAKEQFIYTQISHKEGLTSTVNSIYKENDGDVWIGAQDGLYRLDGHTLHQHKDSLFHNQRVIQIHTDRHGNFWVLTSEGLTRRGSNSNDFEPMSIPDGGRNTQFCSWCEDENGIWFGSLGKIYRYSFHDSKLRLFLDITEHGPFLFSNICDLDNETLLCTSNNGSVLVDKNTGETFESPFGTTEEISSSMIDSQGRVWIAFYNKGISVYDSTGELLKRYTKGNSGLNCDIILSMTERESRIWTGTDGGGINIIDFNTDNVEIITNTPGDQFSFPTVSIKSLYKDQYGNVWAGSVRDGLIQISTSGMLTFSDTHLGLSNGLSNSTVLFVYQDEYSDDIWIGTDGEGINRYNPADNTFTHYPATFDTKVVSIASYSKDELVISLYSHSISLFNKKTGKIRPLNIEDEDIKYNIRYAGRGINLLNEGEESLIFIGNNVKRYNRATGKCTRVSPARQPKYGSTFYAIGSTKDGIWFHNMHEIHFLPTGSSQMERIGANSEISINGGCVGEHGQIWLATDRGLCRFDPHTNEWDLISTKVFKDASSVICDRNARIWVGTGNNIFAYLTDFKSFAIFGKSDGARPNEYLNKSRLLSRTGDIYLGGVQGLLRIDSSYVIDSSENPVVSLYSVSTDNEEANRNKKGIYIIPRECRKLSIEVSIQEKDIFRDKKLRFYLSGDKGMFETKSLILSIRQMPAPGTYDMSVSCLKRNGEWSTPVTLMTMKIPQLWYLTWWFISCGILFILLITSTIFGMVIRHKDNRLKEAMRVHDQKVYEEKVKLLINISHELRTPLTLIMAPLKRILKSMDSESEEYPTLARIHRQSRRMKDLLDMVLDLRKMEVGKSGLKIERLEFNRWLSETIEDVINEESHDGIEIKTVLDPEIQLVDFDRRKCDTVLMNIVMNAIKHSCEGDTITIKTELTTYGFVRVSISDEGPGLKDLDNSQLFSDFYQGNSEQYGSGIGLSYSKILVELHGGQIAAENNQGKGATFWWEIPVVTSKDIMEQTPRAYLNELMGFTPEDDAEDSEEATFSMSNMTLMLVDDNKDLLDFLREALSSEFAEIITVTSGNKALAALTSGKLPDIIVSDINMPDGDGYRLCNEVKKNERFGHIPFVLLTSRGEDQSQSDSYRMGADSFLAKPFEIDTLIEMIRGILKRREDTRRKYLDYNNEDSASYGSKEEGFILALNKVITEHISNPALDQAILCRELGMSRAALYNKMKAITGAGAKEYITRIRLEKAKALVETTGLSIVEISEMTGFTSQSYFSTAFKAYTGITPSQYKKKATNK